jgi:hypothetical protein
VPIVFEGRNQHNFSVYSMSACCWCFLFFKATNLCLLIGVFIAFTFNVIIGMLSLLFHACFLFFSYFLLFVFHFFISCGLREHFYSMYTSHSADINNLPVQEKCRNPASLYVPVPSPIFNVIVSNTSSSYSEKDGSFISVPVSTRHKLENVIR